MCAFVLTFVSVRHQSTLSFIDMPISLGQASRGHRFAEQCSNNFQRSCNGVPTLRPQQFAPCLPIRVLNFAPCRVINSSTDDSDVHAQRKVNFLERLSNMCVIQLRMFWGQKMFMLHRWYTMVQSMSNNMRQCMMGTIKYGGPCICGGRLL